jgi:hypothetical protein
MHNLVVVFRQAIRHRHWTHKGESVDMRVNHEVLVNVAVRVVRRYEAWYARASEIGRDAIEWYDVGVA